MQCDENMETFLLHNIANKLCQLICFNMCQLVDKVVFLIVLASPHISNYKASELYSKESSATV